MLIVRSLLLAASLCADCFAVSLCSSLTLKNVRGRDIAGVALSFAVIQTALLALGWGFGYLFVGLLAGISKFIGAALLIYVAAGMLRDGISNRSESRDLNGLRNVVIGGLATSIDALAVGCSQSLSGAAFPQILPLLISVFAITLLSVVLGIRLGSRVGIRFGRPAVIAGGAVLLAIAAVILLQGLELL